MALSRHHGAFSRPLNVQEIVTEAKHFEFHTSRSLQQWLRSAKMLLTEADICEEEQNYQKAYLYLYRHCELVLAKLPEHPDYKNPRFKQELAKARKAVQKNLVKLEQWKPRINQEHQRYVRAMERRKAERQRVQQEFDQIGFQRQSSDQSRRGSRASLGSGPPSPAQLDANANRDFAVELARREIRRRDATRQSTRQAGISPATVASRRRGIVAHEPPSWYEDDSTDEGVREAASHLTRHTYEARGHGVPTRHVSTSYQYPGVPRKESSIDWKVPPAQPDSSRQRHTLPPALPPKESLYDHRASDLPPTVPPKQRRRSPSPPAPLHQAPSKYTFTPTATTESGTPLRTVLLPPDLHTTFLALAHPNTTRNLETCGILCATLISNALFITHLLLPDQTSTSDTCDTTEEGDNALFDYCDAHNLLVCGWIHTHPSQSCFLSSRDLHTSSGYQVMLPEAVAIVCAPKSTPAWGIFRLTDPPGLEHVLGCREKGLFHPHAIGNLYTDASRPGHVVEGPGLEVEVVDMRK